MKKRVCAIILCVISLFSASVFALNAENVPQGIYINDVYSEYDYQYFEGYRYIPLRQVSEKLGYTVKWDDINKSVYLVKGTMCENEKGKSDFVCIYTDSLTAISWSYELRDFGNDVAESVSIKIVDGATYISPLDYCRLLDLKLKPYSENEFINIYTR